ncbi:MAG: acyl-CoA thioesterase [Planctomycetota bacterium]|jgi:acyl-CoA thioester hydrolase
MITSTTLQLRARYTECDPMGLVHHTVYPIWFEMARVELLRENGASYAQLEEQGTLIVVVNLEVNYKKPARYDDQLTVTANLIQATGVRIQHEYAIHRDHQLLVTGKTTLACLDRDTHQLIPVPDFTRYQP